MHIDKLDCRDVGWAEQREAQQVGVANVGLHAVQPNLPN